MAAAARGPCDRTIRHIWIGDALETVGTSGGIEINFRAIPGELKAL